MNKLASAAFFAIFICTISSSFSQDNTLLLKSGDYTINQTSHLTWTAAELIDNQFYRIIVFESIPKEEEKAELLSAGIELLNYLPQNAFFASISPSVNWTVLQQATVIPVLTDYKLSRLLSIKEYPHWTLYGENKIELVASYFDALSYDQVVAQVNSIGATIFSSNSDQKTISVGLDIADLESLYSLSVFYYFEILQSEGIPENGPGRTDHRSNALWTEFNGGLEYNGSGITIMMQDDGIIGPHIDYTGRIDQSNCSGCTTSANNTHGDHVSGTIMGAGNLNPANRGMAHGADLLVYSSNNNNYNSVPNLYDNSELVITSKSYSDGCNDGYTSLARQLDQQTRERPSLIHVFSAGNNGASACSPNNYGAGATWGNITGGHKMGKNLLTVGNLTHLDVISSSSSRGPATDGRIKPDICAVGTSVTSTGPENIYFTISGTSMACPGIAGTVAQLYEGYKDLNGGINPDAALIKATVLNTAEDLGNSGPDFIYGWGRVNARQAYDLISSNQYIQGSISQGGNNLHTIAVPAGVSELRVMVYWTDYEGTTNSNPSLVNDINMVVTDPTLTNFDPWVLDPTPANVALTAVRAVDNLNNVEQVTLVNPISGNYDVNLNGFAIPQGPQDYYLVYYFVRDEITVTYPIGAEGISTSTSNLIRWDAPEGVTDFTIEYTLDDGVTWVTDGTANANRRYYTWSTPNSVTGLAKIRVSRLGSSDESDAVFSLINVPANLNFAWNCPDSSNLSWDGVTGATAYEISMLGVNYMDSIGTTSATNFTIPIGSAFTGWFSVRALGPDNARGERAIAIEKTLGEFNCVWSTPIADFSVDCTSPSGGTGHCYNITEQSGNTDASSTYMWYFPGGIPATSTDPNPIVCYSTPGQYDVAMVVSNSVSSDSIYQTNAIYVSETGALPYFEGFENYINFTNLDQWSTVNPDVNQEFAITTDAALSGSKSARLYNQSQTGNFTDELVSGPIDLTSLISTDTMTLSFRYSYRKKLASNDEWLKVFITQSCEDTWVQRKTIHGDALSSITTSGPWIPTTDSDWTTVHVTNITSAFFMGDFRFKFIFESDNGNNMYLDNINLYQGAPSDDLILGLGEMELTELNVFPNPTDGDLNLEFNLNNAHVTKFTIIDLTGKEIESHTVSGQAGKNVAFMNVNTLSSGVYFLRINVDGTSQQLRFVIQ